MTVNEYLSKDNIKWFHGMIFKSQILLLFFLINFLEYNKKTLAAINKLWLLGKVSNLWLLGFEDQALCGSDVKVVDQLSVRLNSFFFAWLLSEILLLE